MARKRTAVVAAPPENGAPAEQHAPPEARPEATQANGNGEKRRPAVSYKLPIGPAALEVAVWEQRIKSQYDGSDVSVFSVSVSRSYRTDEGWKQGGGFRTQELAPLQYLLDKALGWILSTKTEDSSMPF